MKYFITTIFIFIVSLFMIVNINNVSANAYVPTVTTRTTSCANYEVVMINSSAVISNVSCETTYSAALTKANAQSSTMYNVASIIKNKKIIYTKYGLVDYNINGNVDTYTTSSLTTKYTYINPAQGGTDALFLAYNDSNGAVQIKLSNHIGWIINNTYTIVPISVASNRSHYVVQNNSSTNTNELFHNILKIGQFKASSGVYYTLGALGPAPSGLSAGTIYYSYDGHYFYTDFTKMVNDVRSNSNANAINGTKPHFNYYQYLPHRSKTFYDATTLNNYINNRVASNSKLKDLGATFKDAENKYGSHALLMLAVAANESSWGTSTIALDKNNLFGHGAVDTNPYYSATGYTTPANSVYYHADYFVNRQYSDVKGDWRYFGAHLGDKGSGINVKYASDPYWGEKAATIAYQVDNANGLQEMKNAKQIVVKTTSSNVPVYKDANTSTLLYNLNNKSLGVSYIPQIKLGESGSYYKVQTDMGLSSNRTVVAPSSSNTNVSAYLYNWTNSYGYIAMTNMFNVSKLVTKTGSFYLHNFTWDNTNKKLNITGYAIVNGVNNIATVAADYQLLLTDQNNVNNKYYFSLPRMSSSSYPFPIGKVNGYDCSAAWFSGSFDINSVPQGNYNISLIAQTNNAEATMVIDNLMSKPMTRKAVDSSNRGIMLRANFPKKGMPLELYIRNNGLNATSIPSTIDNMFNEYSKIEFSGNNLRIRGTSFNVGVDYSISSNITRQIILENTTNFNQIIHPSNYLDNGDYTVSLKVSDNKSKTRAWFDTSFDVSNLDLGTYSIIIKTKSGTFEDAGELTDVMMRSLPAAYKIGTKTYTLKVNSTNRWRIEMTVT